MNDNNTNLKQYRRSVDTNIKNLVELIKEADEARILMVRQAQRLGLLSQELTDVSVSVAQPQAELEVDVKRNESIQETVVSIAHGDSWLAQLILERHLH